MDETERLLAAFSDLRRASCLGGCERRVRTKDGYCCRAHRRITREGFRPRVHGFWCDLAESQRLP